jgi:hypothetical protein
MTPGGAPSGGCQKNVAPFAPRTEQALLLQSNSHQTKELERLMLCGTLLCGALSPLSDVLFLLLGRLLSRGSRSVVGSTSKPTPEPADRLWGDCQRASGLISGRMGLPSGCGLKITYRRRTCHAPWRNADNTCSSYTHGKDRHQCLWPKTDRFCAFRNP